MFLDLQSILTLGQTTAPVTGYHPGNWLVPLAMALVVLGVTVEMIRRRKLREEYALLWMGASIALLIVAIFPNMVIWLQDKLQVNYLTIVVLAMFTFLSMIVMHFAIVISHQAEEIRQLAQKFALLNGKLEEMSAGKEESKDKSA